MPEPVYASQLQCIIPFRKYIHENIRSWYRFVKNDLGRRVDNGGLRVVEGCRKSTAFGIATVANDGALGASTELTFSVDQSWADITGCKYGWHHIGSAEVNSGPSLTENLEIQQELDIVSGRNSLDPVFRNQCLFVDTHDFTLQETEWEHIDDNESAFVTTSKFPDSRSGSASSSASYSMSPGGVQSNSSSSSLSSSANGGGMDTLSQQSACTLSRSHERKPWPNVSPSEVRTCIPIFMEMKINM